MVSPVSLREAPRRMRSPMKTANAILAEREHQIQYLLFVVFLHGVDAFLHVLPIAVFAFFNSALAVFSSLVCGRLSGLLLSNASQHLQ